MELTKLKCWNLSKTRNDKPNECMRHVVCGGEEEIYSNGNNKYSGRVKERAGENNKNILHNS